jgi:hypothetical protein
MWIREFRLGRPGFEEVFELLPDAVQVIPASVAVVQQNLAGDLRKGVLKTSAPTIRISSNYMSVAQRNTFASMMAFADSFLSFRTRDDWQQVLEYNLPASVNTVTLQNSSMTRLSAALAALGIDGSISIDGVYLTKNGQGQNYFTGGAYDDASRTITLGAALADIASPVYVTYTYDGWLVNMKAGTNSAKFGSDHFAYEYELEGA